MERDKRAAAPPRQFVVAPFSVDATRVKENPYRKNPGTLASDSQQLLQAALVAELKQLRVPTKVGVAAGADPGTWLVSGRLTRVSEGNRLLRMGIGLGAGGTKMETQVEVRAGAQSTPFLRFGTTGGSNATPGAATTPVPFSSVPMALWNSKDGVSADAARTARMITASIAEYMAERGWLMVQREKPKMKR